MSIFLDLQTRHRLLLPPRLEAVSVRHPLLAVARRHSGATPLLWHRIAAIPAVDSPSLPETHRDSAVVDSPSLLNLRGADLARLPLRHLVVPAGN